MVGILLFNFLVWGFVYFSWGVSPGLDRAAYDRGEEVHTIDLKYFGPKTHGPYESSILERMTFETQDGRRLSPEEAVQVINPALNPYVKDGKVYLHTPAKTEWGWHFYHLDPSPVSTTIAKLHRFVLD